MTLEGMIRDAAGEAAVRTVEAANYMSGKQMIEQLVSEGFTLLWIRTA